MARIDASDSRAPGAPIRAARLARVRMIRRRVVSGAVALFVAVWMLIAVTLISGHDPALAKRSTASSSSPGTTATLTSSSGSASSDPTSSSGASSSSASSAGTGSSTSGLGAVTTSQS